MCVFKTTTAVTPLTTLVRSVTVDTTRSGWSPFAWFASLARMNCIPGAKGFHWLSILGGLGKFAGSNSAAVLQGGGLGSAPDAETESARSNKEAIRIVNTA